MKVALADYGAGNLRSLCFALERAGGEPHVTTDPAEVLEAPLALIAGVGHVESAAAGLARTGLDDALRERGAGLGLLEGPVRRLEARRVPHMGWNALAITRPAAVLEGLDGEDVYFAHSFAAVPVDPGVVAATVDHDQTVVAAVEAGALAGLQFHPERSAAAGARVLDNLLRWSRSA